MVKDIIIFISLGSGQFLKVEKYEKENEGIKKQDENSGPREDNSSLSSRRENNNNNCRESTTTSAHLAAIILALFSLRYIDVKASESRR